MTNLLVTNTNYCCSVVQIKVLNPIKGLDNLQQAMILGNSVLVGKNTKPGDVGLFFPLESALNVEFLKNNNLYRETALNVDPTKKGFFEKHGRVRAVRFKNVPSEGFFCGLEFLNYLNPAPHLIIGQEFNEIGNNKICEKYIPKSNKVKGEPGTKKNKEAVKVSRLKEGWFRLHYDCENLKKNIDKIYPDDIVALSKKVHGTSFVVAKVLTTRPLTWFEKILTKYFKISINTDSFDTIYSSRKVIKNGFINANPDHFYKYDIWKDISDQIKDVIPENVSIYGEATGFLPTGAAIQKGYSYGCKPNTFKINIYRVTVTNNEGKVFELSWNQMKEFCASRGLETVHEYYYGRADGIFPGLTPNLFGMTLNEWQEELLDRLLKCEEYNMNNSMCKENDYLVPAEGICLRKDALHQSQVWKLKNSLFLQHETLELDKGEQDIETEQSLEGDEDESNT